MDKATLEKIKDSVEIIEKDINYFMIRTDSGEYYKDFKENNHVGLDYIYLDPLDFRDLDSPKTRKKVFENLDKSKDYKNPKMVVSTIIGKAKTFANLKLGDIVIIPSKDSDYFLFGEITRARIEFIEQQEKGKYKKYKKVKWLKEVAYSKLDPHFLEIRTPHHAIYDVSKLSEYINKELYGLFIDKKLDINLVFDFKEEDDIPFFEMLDFLNAFKELAIQINKEYGLNEDLESLSLKFNLQSPGNASLKQKSKNLVLIVAALAIASYFCKKTLKTNEAIKELPILDDSERIKKPLDSLLNSGMNLELDLTKVNSYF